MYNKRNRKEQVELKKYNDIRIGEMNKLEILRERDFGFYIGNENEDLLLPKTQTEGMDLKEGDTVEVFVYRDSQDRAIATFKKPLAFVGEVSYLEVVGSTEFGAFISIGMDRDVFVPLKEQRYKLMKGNKYLFYLYIDKTDRIAATTEVENYLSYANEDEEYTQGEIDGVVQGRYKIGDEVTAQVFGRTEGGTLNVAIDSKYRGLVLPNEYYEKIFPGEELKLRVKRLYEDGMIGLTPRKTKLNERDELKVKILNYLEEHNGFMEFNDKSNPETIKAVFGTSKNYFKMTLGGLMKEGKIKQDVTGTTLIK